jgi:hypothetical protein
MTQTSKAVVAGLAIFAVYLPIAMLVHSYYVQIPQPSGKAVELLKRFWFQPPNQYAVRPHLFHPPRFTDVSQFTVYENITPLPRENFEALHDKVPAQNGITLVDSFAVRFRTSDGSDPRTNGRQYWIVAH